MTSTGAGRDLDGLRWKRSDMTEARLAPACSSQRRSGSTERAEEPPSMSLAGSTPSCVASALVVQSKASS